jgi:hypothetical protein
MVDITNWVRAAAVAALVYPVVGIGFALPLHSGSSHLLIMTWRLAAWIVSAATFAIHLAYERSRLRSTPFRGALHAAAAVAVGAFLLAVWINGRRLWDASAHHSSLAPLALVLFPVVTGIPAFLFGWGTLALLGHFKHRNS